MTGIKPLKTADLILNPIVTARVKQLALSKKIAYIALSVFIGFCTVFIPHLIFACLPRKVTKLHPQPVKKNPPPPPAPAPALAPAPLPTPSPPTPPPPPQPPPLPLPPPPVIQQPKPKPVKPPPPPPQQPKKIWHRQAHRVATKVLQKITVPDGVPKPGLINSPSPPQRRLIPERAGDPITIPNTPPTTPEMFFHLHASAFGHNSRLEGYSKREVLNFLIPAIQLRIPQMKPNLQGVYRHLLDQFTAARDLAHPIPKDQYIALMQQRLATRQPFLVPGGWAGVPGHAIYYKIIPTSDTKCTFRLYNLGAGSDAQESVDEKRATYLDWKGVDLQTLMHPDVLQALWEFNLINDQKGQKTEYSENDFYVSLRDVLKPVEEESSRKRKKNEQAADICAFTSALAVIDDELDLDEYKRFTCDLRIQTLCNEAQKNTPVNPRDHNLWHKALQATVVHVTSQVEQGNLPTQYLTLMQQKMQEAETNFNRRALAKQDIPLGHAYKAPNDVPAPPEAAQADRARAAAAAAAPRQPPTLSIQSIKLLSDIRALNPTLSQIRQLHGLITQNDAWKTEGQAIHQGVLEWILKIPMNIPNLSLQESRELLRLSADIVHHYYYSWVSVSVNLFDNPERKFILLKFWHLQTQLTAQTFRSKQGVWFYPAYMENVWINAVFSGCLPYAQEIRKQYGELMQVLQRESDVRNSDGKIKLERDTWFGDGQTETIYNYNIPEFLACCRNTDVYRAIAALNPHASNAWYLSELFKPENFRALPGEYRAQLASSFFWQQADRAINPAFDRYKIDSHALEIGLNPKIDGPQENSLKFQARPTLHHWDRPILSYALGKVEGSSIAQFFRAANEQLGTHFYDTYETRNALKPPPHFKDIMSREELYLFNRLFASSATAINDLLAYCKAHPEAIQQNDFRKVFLALLIKFAPYAPTDTLKVQHLYNLEKWLSRKFMSKIALGKQEIGTCLFLLRALGMISQFEIKTTTNLVESYQRLLALCTHDIETRKQIYAQILAYFSTIPKLTDGEKTLYLQAKVYLARYTFRPDDIDPLLAFQADQAKLIHADPALNPSLIDTLISEIEPHVQKNGDWALTQEGIYTSTRLGATFHPITGELRLPTPDGLLKTLPYHILKDANFQKLFPKVYEGRYFHNNIADPYYEFEDKKTERLTRAYLGGKIEQHIAGYGWYSVCQNEVESENLLQSKNLTLNYRHWMSQDGHTIISENDAHEIQYESQVIRKADKKLEATEIRECVNRLKLSQPAPIFQNLDHPAYIEQWHAQNGTLQKVALPRLGLTFKAEGLKLHCNEIPGYYLELDKANYFPIENFKHGLVLTNGKTQKYIVPRLDIQKPLAYEVLEGSFLVNYHEDVHERSSISFYTLDVQQDGRLTTKSREAELYLAAVYAVAQDYKKSAEILKKHRGQLFNFLEYPRFAEALKIIVNLPSLTGDTDPNAAALGAFAGFLLIQNGETYGYKAQVHVMQIGSHYQRYLRKHKHVHALILDPNEEIYLISKINQPPPIIQDRLANLSAAPAAVHQILTTRTQYKRENILPKREDLKIDVTKHFDHTIPDDLMVTRPNIAANFQMFYHWSKAGTAAQKEKLRCCLEFAHKDLDASLANFLKLVLAYPNEFDPLPAADWESALWIQKQHKTAVDKKLIVPPHVPLPERRVQIPTTRFFTLPPPHEKLPNQISFKEGAAPRSLASETDTMIGKEKQKIPPVDSLKAFLTSGNQDDPIIKKEYERLKSDLQAYEKSDPVFEYSVIDRARLEAQIQPAVDISGLEREILKRANATTPSAQYDLLKLSKHITPFTLNQLIENLTVQKPQKLLRRNPTLTAKDIEGIYSLIFDYLLLATKEQQKLRACKALEELRKAENELQTVKPEFRDKKIAEIDARKAHLAAVSAAIRNFTPQANDKRTIAFLGFEYFGNLLLREKQVKDFSDFLDGKGDENLVKEMIMGSGKSKVLNPILAHLRADGVTISSIITAPQFFKDVASHSDPVLQDTFGQTLRTIHFDRKTPITQSSMDNILRQLRAIQADEDCLIMTSKSKKCMLLRFLEEWFKCADGDKKVPKELETFKEIITLLMHYEKPIMDEVDTVLETKHQDSYSYGKLIRPDPALIQVVQSIYQLLYTDEELKSIVQIESDPQPNREAPALTVQNYHIELKWTLAEKFLDKLKSTNFADDKYQKAVEHLKKMSKDDLDLLKNFLCQDIHLSPIDRGDAEAAYDELPKDLQRLMSIAGLQIGRLLDRTLTKPCDEKYTVVPGTLFAIPCTAVNAPCIGSEFLLYITIDCTIQYFAKKGISQELVKKQFEEVLQQLDKANEKESQGLNQKIQRWCNKLDLLSLKIGDDEAWQQVQQKLNAPNAVQMRLEFIQDFIFPEMEYFSEKISSNPQNLIDMNIHSSGDSGTLYNNTSYHWRLKPKPDEGTDSKTLALLFKQGRAKDPALNLSDKPEEMLAAFRALGGNLDMLCDNGGYFRHLTNLKAAELISNTYKKPVVFYHNKQQMVFIDKRVEPYKEGELAQGTYFTFLDQVNCTGADIGQHPLAESIVTIKKGMLLRDILQTVWRLRGLDTKQRVHFAVSDEIAHLIRENLQLQPEHKIAFEEILRYGINNQARQVGEDAYTGFKQQLLSVKQKVLVDALLSPISNDDKFRAIDLLKSTWITSELTDPAERFNSIATEILSAEAVSTNCEQTIAFLKAALTPGPRLTEALAHVEKIREKYSALGVLSHKVVEPAASCDDTMEVVAEQEINKDLNIELEEAVINPEMQIQYIPGNHLQNANIAQDGTVNYIDNAIPYMPLANYLKNNAFDDIDISINMFHSETPIPHNTRPNLNNFSLFGNFPKHFDYMLIENNRIKLISHEDVNPLARIHQKDLYSLKSEEFSSNREPLTPAEREKVVRIKFLAGQSYYTDEELPLLEKWLKANNPKMLCQFFEQTILKCFNTQIDPYRNSRLRTLFNKLVI